MPSSALAGPLGSAVATNERVFHLTAEPDLSYDMMLDPTWEDPIVREILEGRNPGSLLRRLMLSLVTPGDRVLDLGAHVGIFALPAAAAGCQVLAVEAAPRQAALLRTSARRNRFSRLQVVDSAIGAEEGRIEFCPLGSHGRVAAPGMELPRISVPVTSVDRLLTKVGWPRVDFIKMDIEGSEPAALEGMARLLGQPDAPPVCYECNAHTLAFYGKTSTQLRQAFEDFGYCNYAIEPDGLVPVRARDLQPEVSVDYLALKGTPPDHSHWPVLSRYAGRRIRARLLWTCWHSHPHVRSYGARVLQDAGWGLRLHPRIVRTLAVLEIDPDPEVRAAAAWFRKRCRDMPVLRAWRALVCAGSRLRHCARRLAGRGNPMISLPR